MRVDLAARRERARSRSRAAPCRVAASASLRYCVDDRAAAALRGACAPAEHRVQRDRRRPYPRTLRSARRAFLLAVEHRREEKAAHVIVSRTSRPATRARSAPTFSTRPALASPSCEDRRSRSGARTFRSASAAAPAFERARRFVDQALIGRSSMRARRLARDRERLFDQFDAQRVAGGAARAVRVRRRALRTSRCPSFLRLARRDARVRPSRRRSARRRMRFGVVVGRAQLADFAASTCPRAASRRRSASASSAFLRSCDATTAGVMKRCQTVDEHREEDTEPRPDSRARLARRKPAFTSRPSDGALEHRLARARDEFGFSLAGRGAFRLDRRRAPRSTIPAALVGVLARSAGGFVFGLGAHRRRPVPALRAARRRALRRPRLADRATSM